MSKSPFFRFHKKEDNPQPASRNSSNSSTDGEDAYIDRTTNLQPQVHKRKAVVPKEDNISILVHNTILNKRVEKDFVPDRSKWRNQQQLEDEDEDAHSSNDNNNNANNNNGNQQPHHDTRVSPKKRSANNNGTDDNTRVDDDEEEPVMLRKYSNNAHGSYPPIIV